MKYLSFILKHFRANRFRTGSTVLAIAFSIFLLCTLQAVLQAFRSGLESANAARLVTRHAVSLAFNLPLAYKGQIGSVAGVKRVATTTWFGGVLPGKKQERGGRSRSAPNFADFFANYAVDVDTYFAMYPEYIVRPSEFQAFRADRRACLLGRGLAERFGWKVGDRFHLESFIPPYRRAEGPLEFVVRGIYDVDLARHPGTDDRVMFFDYEYLYEAVLKDRPRWGAGMYTVEILDPSAAPTVGRAIDALFENSDAQTRTETEQAFRAGVIAMAGDLAVFLNSVVAAVAFMMLLVTANTMSMALRERRAEIAVLKTLGFRNGQIMALFLGEAFLLGALGAALGLLASRFAIEALPRAPLVGEVVRSFPQLGLSFPVASLGLATAILLSVAAAFLPALFGYRARIPDLLRQP